jgi:FkbM family methyltransferase
MELSAKHRILRALSHQKWMIGRNRMLRAFANPERQESFPFEVDFFGRSYSGNLTNFIDWTVFFYGAYTRHELLLLAAIAGRLRARGTPINFFDVGANVGQHAMFMSGHADKVVAFEPFSVVRSEMARKLRHAKVDNVEIFPIALGDRNETGNYHPPVGANTATGTLSDYLPPNAAAEVIPVEVARGDDFFAANNLPPISLLKIDVEGYEAKVLEGMHETLLRDRPPILMEIHGPSRSGFETLERLKSLLYPDHLLFEAIPSRRRHFGLKPFSMGGPTEITEALVLPSDLAGFAQDSGGEWRSR